MLELLAVRVGVPACCSLARQSLCWCRAQPGRIPGFDVCLAAMCNRCRRQHTDSGCNAGVMQWQTDGPMCMRLKQSIIYITCTCTLVLRLKVCQLNFVTTCMPHCKAQCARGGLRKTATYECISYGKNDTALSHLIIIRLVLGSHVVIVGAGQCMHLQLSTLQWGGGAHYVIICYQVYWTYVHSIIMQCMPQLCLSCKRGACACHIT